MPVKGEYDSGFLYTHSEEPIPWFVQALQIYRDHFAIQFPERSFYNPNYKGILKAVLGKKLVGLAGKIKRPVHQLKTALRRAHNLTRRFFMLLNNLVLLAYRYHGEHRSSQAHHFCAERAMNALSRHFSDISFKYRRSHVRDYNMRFARHTNLHSAVTLRHLAWLLKN